MKKLTIKNNTPEEIYVKSNVFSDQKVANPQIFSEGEQKTINLQSDNGDIEISISQNN